MSEVVEPTGLYATVVDADGVWYVRVSDRKRPWLRVGTTNCVHWSEADPVFVMCRGKHESPA